MSQILTQEEVDALLHGIAGGEIATDTGKQVGDSGVLVYDLTSQDRIIRGRMPTLEMIQERFTRSLRTSISSVLRRVIDVSVVSTDMIKFGEFLRSIPLPTSLHLLKMEPLKGYILLVMDGRLIFSLVDIFFGGKGSGNIKLEGRDFTPIENRIIKNVINIIIHDYNEAWQPVHEINVTYVRSEMNPQFVTFVPSSDVVVITECELEFEQGNGKMTFCVPYSTIEPIRDKLKTGYQSESLELDNAWTERIKVRLKDSPISIRSMLGSATITGKDLLNLKVGDIIQLNEDQNSLNLIYVENVLKFFGITGAYSGSRAIKITDICPNPEARKN